MSKYMIVPNSDGISYNIAIEADNGLRQTMLGFESEAEATAWIEYNKRHEPVEQTDAD